MPKPIQVVAAVAVVVALLGCPSTAAAKAAAANASTNHIPPPNCDENSYPAETTKASSLAPNTFHKLCPSTSSLGTPRCGDNSAFSFYYTSPVRRRSSSKVLLQFMGGGACWDGMTCQYQSDQLRFPDELDTFLEQSCSDIQSTLLEWGQQQNQQQNQQHQQQPVAMLCAQSIGNLNFRNYHTIVVPYCTQDVYSGSRTVTYNTTNQTVHHTGAHNLLAVLQYVYQNFPHPEHIVLTGCSAGGTAVPMAYDLLYHHYNRWRTGYSMPLASVMDSPVYLTPQNFLTYGLPHWNAKPLMNKLHFDYDTYSQQDDYSTKLMEHVLKRGSKRDPWGIITHSNDPVSLEYYQSMATNVTTNEFTTEPSESSVEQWWSLLSYSFNQVLSTHANVDRYIINSQGHCSFGLYYAQTEGGDDFERWATTLLQFRPVREVSGMKWLLVALAIGCLGSCCCRCLASRENAAPITIAYGITTTIYFVCAVSWNNLENWIYNPSLGPMATTLSAFGINNPTLIVYQHQWLRLIVSTFLCSGILTLAMVLGSLYCYIRPLEQSLRRMSWNATSSGKLSSMTFLELCILLTCGSNLLYACLTDGASCSSMALILGLQSFSCTLRIYHRQQDFPRPLRATFIMYIGTCLCFPLDNWILLTSAILMGILIGMIVYRPLVSMQNQEASARLMQKVSNYGSYPEEEANVSSKELHPKTATIVTRRTFPTFVMVLLLVFLLLLLFYQIPNPDTMYSQPFLTGCDFAYTTQVDEIAQNYADLYPGYGNHHVEDNGRSQRRRLVDKDADRDFTNMCAQFCVPRLVSRPFLWSATVYTGINVQRGYCDQVGYEQHIADKTFSYKSYSVDVELYYNNSYDQDIDSDDTA